MLFSGIISFDPCIFHKSGIISADISRNQKVEKLLVFFQVNLLLKQPFADALQSSCSKKLRNIHRKTLALESPLNKILVLQTCYFKSNSNEDVLR